MRCRMCSIWQNPSRPEDELKPRELEMLPSFKFVNITGGEPFVRRDLPDIIEVLRTKTPRIVISTSGWFDDRVAELARRFPDIGVRVSIEGMREVNDTLRGRAGGFDKGVGLLRKLREMGLTDIGFGITVGNMNSADMLRLYDLSHELGMEFATAAVHNSFYFCKHDNVIDRRLEVTANFRELIERQMREKHPKSWFRAYFNMGLLNYVNGGHRLLPCEAGSANIFIDPHGEVLCCNGMASREDASMGNIRSGMSFGEIWNSRKADDVRRRVAACRRDCWMVGTASPVMKKYVSRPAAWVVANKLRSLAGRPVKLLDKVERIINNENSANKG